MSDPITAIFEEALSKYHPATDRRDFLQETEAEIVDAINYLAMFLMKLRATAPTRPRE